MDGLTSFFAIAASAQVQVWASALILLAALLFVTLASLAIYVAVSHALRKFRNSAREIHSASEGSNHDSAKTDKTRAQAISKRLSEHGAWLTALQVRLAKMNNTMFETQPGSAQAPATSTDNRQRILSLWRSLQDLVERSAADSRIEAAQRAKYAQEDRRDYLQFIQCLHSDGHLGGDLELWRRACELSRLASSGRDPIAAATVQEMEDVCDALFRSAECETGGLRTGNVIKLRSKLPQSDEIWKTNRIAAKSLEEDPFFIPAGTTLGVKSSATDMDGKSGA